MVKWEEIKDKTWYDVFEEVSYRYPEKEALVFNEKRVRYKDYRKNIMEFAKALIGIGVKKGDSVALWMTNRIEWIYSKWAINKIGAVLVPLNTRYKTTELKYVLAQSDATTLIMEDRFLGKFDALGMLKEVCPAVESCAQGKLNARDFPSLKNIVCLGEDLPGACFSLEDFLKQGSGIPEADTKVAISPDDTGTIMYTSGTTGLPKGAMLSHRSHLCCIAIAAQLYGIEESHIYLGGVAPFFGNIGMFSFSVPVFVGATAVLMETFDVGETLKLIDREKVTHTILVPTMLVMMMEHPEFSRYDVRSLKVIMSGGAILQSKVAVECMAKFSGLKGLMNAYGLVEGTGITSCVRLGATPDVLEKTVGTALPYCTIHIMDPDSGEALSVGEEGEICTREVISGCHFMKGYYKDPEQTAATIKNGYLYSGDMGKIRADGNLQITGRIKDMILVGGFNVYPAEIEGFLVKHPSISECSVVGVPDARLGEVPTAFVKLKKKEEVTSDEIIAFCKDKIANLKLPRYVFFVDEFPMTPQGKVQKFKLEDLAAIELSRIPAEKC